MASTKVHTTQLNQEAIEGHYIKLGLTNTQAINAGPTGTQVEWETTLLKSPNTMAFHNPASLPDRIYPQTAGLWLFTAQVGFEFFTSGFVAAVLSKGLTGIGVNVVSTIENAAATPRFQVSALIGISVVGTDYVTLGIQHETGATRNVIPGESSTWISGALLRRT